MSATQVKWSHKERGGGGGGGGGGGRGRKLTREASNTFRIR